MSGDTTLLFVTQVAPYLDGPAGVHGVLDQAAVGVAQVAELHGLRARRVDDVRELDDRALARSARRSRCSRSARRRGAAASGSPSSTGSVPVRSPSSRSTRRPTRVTRGTSTDRSSAPASTAIRGPRRSRSRSSSTSTPRPAISPPSWRWHDEVYQFRDLRPDARVLLRVPESQLDLGAPRARSSPRSGSRCRGASPKARGGRSPPASGTSRARGRTRRTCGTSPAASRGRWARVRSAGGRETVARTRNFSPWAYWMLQLEAIGHARPVPRRRRRRDPGVARPLPRPAGRVARRTAGARPARPRGARVRRLRNVPARIDRVRHRGRRCRCRRSCSSRTTAPGPGPAVLAQHGHGPGKSEVCGLDDDESRSAVAEHNGDYAHQLAAARLRRARSRPAVLRRAGRLEPARQVRLRPQPRARGRRRRRTRSPRTSGTSPARSTCSRPHPLVDPERHRDGRVCRTEAPSRCSSPRGTSGCASPS